VRRLLEEFKARERHVCELMVVPRSSGRYQSRRDDSQIQERLRELAREHPRFGYRRLHLYLHKEMAVNHKKVQRVYRELGLSVKRTRRKHLRRTLQPRPVLTAPNQEWALDFAGDVTAAGQRFRVVSVRRVPLDGKHSVVATGIFCRTVDSMPRRQAWRKQRLREHPQMPLSTGTSQVYPIRST
jgi:putative transposase